MLIKQQLKYLILNTVGSLIRRLSKHIFILQFIYRVKTCKLITVGAYTDSTYQLRSAEKKIFLTKFTLPFLKEGVGVEHSHLPDYGS